MLGISSSNASAGLPRTKEENKVETTKPPKDEPLTVEEYRRMEGLRREKNAILLKSVFACAAVYVFAWLIWNKHEWAVILGSIVVIFTAAGFLGAKFGVAGFGGTGIILSRVFKKAHWSFKLHPTTSTFPTVLAILVGILGTMIIVWGIWNLVREDNV